MPDKPLWLGHLDEILAELASLPHPWVDRATVERVFRVGRRRAQQILAPCVSLHVGANGLADRDQFVAHLRQLAAGDTASYERRRRQRLAHTLDGLRSAWQSRLPVEAPVSIVNQAFADLPPGIQLARPDHRPVCHHSGGPRKAPRPRHGDWE